MRIAELAAAILVYLRPPHLPALDERGDPLLDGFRSRAQCPGRSPPERATISTMIQSAILITQESDAWPWLDLVGLGIVILFLILGAMRGLWWQLIRLLGLIASIAVARALAPRLSPQILEWFPALGTRVAHGLVWSFLFLTGMLLVALIGRVGKAALEGAQLGGIDRLGGAVAGALTGVLIHAALLLCLCQIGSTEWCGAAVRGTQSRNLLERLAHNIPHWVDDEAWAGLDPAIQR
jgi:uncharacterized membrane protein required for colicin V production